MGRTDLLEQVRRIGGLDLARCCPGRRWPARVGRAAQRPPRVSPPLDEDWVEPALEAAAKASPSLVTGEIANRDRAVGARLAGEIALRLHTSTRLRPSRSNSPGRAGQSFGAFAVDGMQLILDGQANDFVGKGLTGGEIVIRAGGDAAQDSAQHVLLGNVALYGATSGRSSQPDEQASASPSATRAHRRRRRRGRPRLRVHDRRPVLVLGRAGRTSAPA